MNIFKIFSIINELGRLPAVQIKLFGHENGRQVYQSFVSPHPRYRVIRNKVLGVGLLRLPPSVEEYLRGRDRQVVRTNRNRALSRGYAYGLFDPLERLDEVLAINASAPVRQQSSMHPSYLSRTTLTTYFSDKPVMHGVFDQAGALKAYAYPLVCGEVFILSRLLGHAEDLDNGIMYYLVSEVIGSMIELGSTTGYPRWGMYDMMVGAPAGLRYFKERLGFKPYRVKWTWEDRP